MSKLKFIEGFSNKIRSEIFAHLFGYTKLYWFSDVNNFGDRLSPLILDYYGLSSIYTTKNKSELLFIGSILDSVKHDYHGTIIGSGFIQSGDPIDLPSANILALRGELTKKRVTLCRDVKLGDPGLLADRLLKNRNHKNYILGIIPHYVDLDDARIQSIQNIFGNQVCIIDVRMDPISIINIIDSCNYILSSSLHGLIIADSLGIDNAWIEFSDKVVGSGFKFHDYYSAMRIDFDPIKISGKENLKQLIELTHKPPELVPQIKFDLNRIIMQYIS